MMSTYRIRPANKKDVSVLVKLNKEGLKHYPWSYDKDYIQRSVAYGNHYVICRNGNILGAIKFYLEQKQLWISTMAIFKEYRGQGYARRLMSFADEIAKSHGYNRIRLDTLTISRVGKFYEKMGYTLIEEGPYYKKRYRIYEKEIA